MIGKLYDICPRGNGYYLAADSGIYELDEQLGLSGEHLPDGTTLVAMEKDRLLYLGYDEAGNVAILDEAGGATPIELGHGFYSIQLLPLGETLWFCDGFKLLRDGKELALPQEPGALWQAAALVDTGEGLSAVLTRTATDTLKPTGAWLVPVDDSTEALSEKDGTELPEPLWKAATFCNPASRCVYADGVLWRFGKGRFSKFVELTQFGLNPSQLQRVLVTEDKILCLQRDSLLVLEQKRAEETAAAPTGSADSTAAVDSTEPAVPKERQTLRVGVLEVAYPELETLMSLINRENTGLTLKITAYEDMERLNLALLEDELDLIVLFDLPVLRNYAEKGLLQPIDELLPELFASDLLYENMVEALKLHGHCYYLPLVMKPYVNWLPDSYGTPPTDLASLAALMEEQEPYSFGWDQRETTFNRWIGMTFGHWVDLEAGTARFDSPEFVELLEFCNRYMLTSEEVFANISAEEALAYRPRFRDYLTLWLGEFMEEYTVAPPFYEGLSPVSLFCLSYVAPAKDADPELLRILFETVLTDENWHTQAKKMDPYATMDQVFLNRQWTEQDITEAEQETLSNPYLGDSFDKTRFKAFVQQVQTLLQEANHFVDIGSELTGIMREEAMVYFNGDCTAEEAARRIQNRVEIYLAEPG